MYLRFKLQDKYNTCALSKHIGKYVYSARNVGKGSANPRLSPVSKPHTHITYMLRQCTSIVYICIDNITSSNESFSEIRVIFCTLLFGISRPLFYLIVFTSNHIQSEIAIRKMTEDDEGSCDKSRTRRVSPVKQQKLLTISGHLSSPPDLCGFLLLNG